MRKRRTALLPLPRDTPPCRAAFFCGGTMRSTPGPPDAPPHISDISRAHPRQRSGLYPAFSRHPPHCGPKTSRRLPRKTEPGPTPRDRPMFPAPARQSPGRFPTLSAGRPARRPAHPGEPPDTRRRNSMEAPVSARAGGGPEASPPKSRPFPVAHVGGGIQQVVGPDLVGAPVVEIAARPGIEPRPLLRLAQFPRLGSFVLAAHVLCRAAAGLAAVHAPGIAAPEPFSAVRTAHALALLFFPGRFRRTVKEHFPLLFRRGAHRLFFPAASLRHFPCSPPAPQHAHDSSRPDPRDHLAGPALRTSANIYFTVERPRRRLPTGSRKAAATGRNSGTTSVGAGVRRGGRPLLSERSFSIFTFAYKMQVICLYFCKFLNSTPNGALPFDTTCLNTTHHVVFPTAKTTSRAARASPGLPLPLVPVRQGPEGNASPAACPVGKAARFRRNRSACPCSP